MIVLQVGEARASYRAATLWQTVIPELHDMVCDMARSNQLATGPFETFLRLKHLSGTVAVSNGYYPTLTPEQLQGLKIGRFHKLAVATCVVPTSEAEASTYWIVAVAYE